MGPRYTASAGGCTVMDARSIEPFWRYVAGRWPNAFGGYYDVPGACEFTEAHGGRIGTLVWRKKLANPGGCLLCCMSRL